MPQVEENIRLTNTQRGGGRWLAHFEVGENTRFCLGLDAPNIKALRRSLWKGMFVIPERGMPSREELYEALVLFKKEAQRRGISPQT